LAPALGALVVFVAVGVCACTGIEQAKKANAKVTLKIDFITSPNIVSNRDQQREQSSVKRKLGHYEIEVRPLSPKTGQ
jgi:predicted component of type VI protein secretion system